MLDVESKNKKLRSGYTTGACAAAAAKAAAILVMRDAACGMPDEAAVTTVEIPFPDGSRVAFNIHCLEIGIENAKRVAMASVIKDAGDDPDVTNGAEIRATAIIMECSGPCVNAGMDGIQNWDRGNARITVRGGTGVGIVTKPGLAVPVGDAAINPVPKKMIYDAVAEAMTICQTRSQPLNPHPAIRIPHLEVTISVPAGEELAKKTLNRRLGIIGGISILGTTGIVRPVSAEAWTATITASMDVAKAAGLGTVVISSGRTSEKAHMKKYRFPDEAYAMMGDYLEFSLLEAKRHSFHEVHLCAQWAKMLKTAMGTPQTHVRHGALEAESAAEFLVRLGLDIPRGKAFNTSREIFDYIYSIIPDPQSAMAMVCAAAKSYAEGITSGIPVIAHLISYEGDILAESD